MPRRLGRWVLGFAVLVFLAAAAAALRWAWVPEVLWRTFPAPAARADTGVELRVVLHRDTIRAGDRQPLQLLYFIVNGPRATGFNNDPERFSFRVKKPDGRMVQPAFWSYPATVSLGPQVQLVLPAGAVLGQMQDLRCISDGAYSRFPETRARDCLAGWHLDTPGTYQVIVRYDGPPPRAWLDSVMADTGMVDLEAPTPGLRLADTATLVVLR